LLGICSAQIPDVRFHLDLYGTYNDLANNAGTLHLYDQLGDASTIEISAYIDTDLRAYVSERLEQFSRDPSKDPLEQYFVEDRDLWRVGKQYLPFGSGDLVRENVLAVKGETKLLFENTKLEIAACYGGTGEQRGVIGRLGSQIGASVAIGDSFGISPTSFDLVRSPSASPGIGQGWKDMFGLDASRKIGQFVTSGEIVWLVNGETQLDSNQNIWDVKEVYQVDRNHSILVGFSHGSDNDVNFLRFSTHIPWTKQATFEPLLRFNNGRFYDLGLTLHVRL
jgi:hypothetical protein